MKWKTHLAAGAMALAAALALGACRRAPEPAPTQMVATAASPAAETVEAINTRPPGGRKPTATIEATAEPATAAPTETLGPYPGPGDAYPASGTNPALDQGGTSYPAPGQDSSPGAYPGPAAQPTTNPYPGPGTQPTTNPYPGPGGQAATATATSPAGAGTTTPLPPGSPSLTPTRTLIPTPAGTPTPLPASPTPTMSPTPTGPRPTLNVELMATDPRTVQLASGKVQVVEFFTFWCGICKAMAPVVNEVAADYDDRVNFIFLDTDDPANREFERKLNFTKEPQFFLLDGQGKVLRQWQGYVSSQSFRDALNFVLQQ